MPIRTLPVNKKNFKRIQLIAKNYLNTVESRKFEVLGARGFISIYRKFEV